MRKLLALLGVALALCLPSPAAASGYIGLGDQNGLQTGIQPNPLWVQGSFSSSIGAFAPSGQATITAGTVTANVIMGSAGPTALVTNNGSVPAYVNFGNSGVTATVVTGYPVNAGQSVAFNIGANTYVAAITSSSTAALSITTGTGLPAIANAGGSGGGGNPAASATGAAVPGNAGYAGLNFAGNLKGWVGDTNGYGDVNVMNVPAVSQSGTWNIGSITTLPALPTGANTIGAISNTAFAISGTLPAFASTPAVTISGNLPAFASTPAFTLSGTGVIKGAGTAGTADAGVVTIQGIASMTPVQVSQATASSLNATVVGTGTFAVQAAQSGTWNIGTVTTLPALPTGGNVIGIVGYAIGSTTSGQSGELSQGAVTTAAPSYSNAATDPLSLTPAGNLRVQDLGTVGQGSTTSGQSGALVQCAVTTGAPSYTTAQTSPASCDTAGNARVNLTTALPAGANTIGGVSPVAAATGGATTFHLVAANSNNSTSIKGSAATVYSYAATNNSATIAYAKFYNKATAPTCSSDTPVFVMMIPASSGFVYQAPVGDAYPLGLGLCVVTGIADNDNTSVAASAYLIQVGYK